MPNEKNILKELDKQHGELEELVNYLCDVTGYNIKRRVAATKRSCRSGVQTEKTCQKNKFVQSDRIKQKGVDKAFDNLFVYTESHFKCEEELINEYGYPGRITHESQHNNLLQKLKSLKYLYSVGERGVVTDLISILNDWLMDHLNSEDKKLVEYLNCKGLI